MTTDPDPVPVPGPDTPRWTVDDSEDGPELTYTDSQRYQATLVDTDIYVGSLSHARKDEAFAALVADVRAARVHEGCAHTTDTLQQARELAAEIVHRPTLTWRAEVEALLTLLTDGGGDG